MKKELNEIYIVESQDDIEKIAKKYQKNTIEILIKNNLLPNMIKKGNILFIKK